MLKRATAWSFFLAATAWGLLAIICTGLPLAARVSLAGVFAAAAGLSAALPRTAGGKAGWFLAVLGALLAWWLLLAPSNARDWAPDVAVPPYAEIYASSVTVRNIRDFDYRTETDYTVRRYDRTYRLDAMKSLDLFLVDWGTPLAAHAMLSYGFADGSHLCFSIETRKLKGEAFSSAKGFFKQYELAYVAADERDAVRLRTNYRKGEKVYLYHIDAEPAAMRLIFLDYLRGMNRLKDRPRWYNALTANCTTGIWRHVAPYYPRARFDWRILASGRLGELVYELGLTDRSLPFAELKKRSLINGRAKAAGKDPAFSRLIRRGLPGFGE